MTHELTMAEYLEAKILMRLDVEHSRRRQYVKRAGGRGDLIHAGRPKAKHMKRRLIAFLKKQPMFEGIRLK